MAQLPSRLEDLFTTVTPNFHKALWVGVGCQRGVSLTLCESALQRICQRYGLNWGAIAGLATLDLKQHEPGLLAFSHDQHWPLIYFSPADLASICSPHPSVKVKDVIGTPSVCEAAAIKAAAKASTAWASSILIVPKQIFRCPSESGAITVAIAQARFS